MPDSRAAELPPLEKANAMALRFLASVPFDSVPKALPDDDGLTLSAVMIYSGLERDGLAQRQDDGDHILYSITPKGITVMQGVDGTPADAETTREATKSKAHA